MIITAADNYVNGRNIVRYLNSRLKPNIMEISEELGVSRQTFLNRFNSLIEKKIIHNFTINIHPNIKLLNLKYVILEIKTNPKEPQLVKKLLKIPQLRSLDGIFGDFSLIALFIFKSQEEYYTVLNKIDEIMAGSYFKKYQIIETIKVFKTNGVRLSNISYDQNFKLDDIDYDILEILQFEMGAKTLSTYKIRKILTKHYNQDISQPTVYNRIKKLEKAGVILNYAVNFNPRKLGFKGKYIVRIKPIDPSKYDDLAFRLEEKSEISDLFRIGEQFGLFAIVRVEEIENFGSFIKQLYDTEQVEDTFTNFILDERKTYTNFIIF